MSWESLPNHLPNAHLFDLVTHFKVLFYFGWYSAINFKLKYSQRFNSVVECLLSVCKILALILDTKDIHIQIYTHNNAIFLLLDNYVFMSLE